MIFQNTATYYRGARLPWRIPISNDHAQPRSRIDA